MYLRILKKDLKRKKAMNVILLVFIILATMFVSSSVNNIISVTTALEDFFEISETPDYFLALNGRDTVATMGDTLSEVDGVTEYGSERVIFAESNAFHHNGKTLDLNNTSIIMSFDDAETNYFDENNDKITDVREGTVVLSGKAMAGSDINIGDKITITIGDKSLEVTVAGGCKDAILGSDLMGMTRFILSEKDFAYFYSENDQDVMYGSLWYIDSEDMAALTEAINEIDNIIFNGDQSMLKMAYALDMVIAGVLLVISICLILVAFVVLNFTISFTLSEEFREIGVMKAIGIKNTKIRQLYLVKYCVMAVVGAFIGFFAGIPFGKLLLDSVSKTIVIKGENTVLINVFCCVAVAVIILLFCYLCTAKVKKFTPIVAIRNGQTGERFTKKSVLRLSRTHGKPEFFMALNDILSAPKRYLSVIFTYVLCMVIVLILVNTANTLRSDKLITVFGTYKSDVYLNTESDEIIKSMNQGSRDGFTEMLDRIEAEMAENGMPCECSIEIFFKYGLSHGDQSFRSMTMYGLNTTADMYTYQEGTPPQNPNEVAITPLVSEKLDAKIGDTITVGHSFGDREYIVTAYYQSMNNLGEGVRLHEDAEVDFRQVAGALTIQLSFTDDPDEKTVAERVDRIKEMYGEEEVMTAGEMVEGITGVADAIDAVKQLTLVLVTIIIALVTVLMERSFITKEQGEIAVLKAIGFKTSSIVAWHSLRFIIISVVSSLIAVILSTPITKLSITPVFQMMGAAFGVEYEINPLEVCIIYPIILLAVTIISSVLTSLYTRTITASQAASIE